MNNTIKIFTTTVCPKCKRLKAFLDEHEVEYEVIDMQSPEGMTELMANGYFGTNAPVLQVDNSIWSPEFMFTGVKLNEHVILDAVC